jgi:hypothetical protein
LTAQYLDGVQEVSGWGASWPGVGVGSGAD